MSDLFISDLHLDPSRPYITQLFLDFLAGEARDASRLYILGDLFEAWIGDDCPGEVGETVINGLAELASAGTAVSFIHGNRDFLIGDQFAAKAGLTLLDEPTVIQIGSRRALIGHGDAQCTDDVEYQQFRQLVRNPAWQAEFLAQSVEGRLAFAAKARAESTQHTGQTAMDIMDVNNGAVDALMVEHNVDLFIHGHTHRPAIHNLDLSNGVQAQRIVLGDWYEQGSVLRWDANGAPALSVI